MNLLESLAALIAHNSLRASLLIGCLLLLRMLLRGRLPARIMHLLWLLVAVRLLLPVAPASDWSVFNLFSAGRAIESDGASGWRVRTEPVPPVPVGPVQHSAEKTRPAQRVAPSGPFPWLPALWLGGVLFQAALLARSALTLHRRLRDAAELRDPRVLEAARRCATETGVRGELRVFETDAIGGPAVAGGWRFRVLLPRGLHERLSDEELRFVLLHECVHLRRHDLAAMWLLTAARAIHWFNPLVWLASRVARTDAELACDEAVLRHDDAPDAYGHTLIRLAQTVSSRQPALPAVGIVESKRSLRTRLSRIGNPIPRTPVRTLLTVLVVGAVVVAFGADEKEAAPGKETRAPAKQTTADAPLPEWAKGWSIVRIVIPSSGNMNHAFVEMRSPKGRAVTLSDGVTSKEGVTLSKIEWTGSPVRAHVVLAHGDEPAELFAEAAVVARDDSLQPRSPQIEIEARFIEIDASVRQQTPALETLRSIVTAGNETRGDKPQPSRIAGALNLETTQKLFRELAQSKEADPFSTPKVTTKSKQRAVIEIIREFRYPTEWEKKGKTWSPTAFEIRNMGVTLEVEPVLSDDGNVIDLNLVPQIVEFLGFVDFETGKPVKEAKRDAKGPLRERITAKAVDPDEYSGKRVRPVFSTRKLTTTVSIYPGQSVVLVLGETEKTDPFPPVSSGKTLVVIVTARPIDPSGLEEQGSTPQTIPPSSESPPSSAAGDGKKAISQEAIDRLLFGPSKPKDSNAAPK